jgi:N-acetylmuramoyl-L-alanine amidase
MADLKTLKYPNAHKIMGRAYHDSGSFSRGQPTSIVLHYTAGHHSADRLHGRNGDSVSCQFTIDRNGDVYQCSNLDQRCHHAGRSEWRGLTGFNMHSIGIEQANWGYWRPGIKPATYQGAVDAGWLRAVHQSGKGAAMLWEPYPEKLVLASLDLCRWLIKEIPTIKYILGHDDIALFRGKVDPGPAFPMERFRALLSGEDLSKPANYKVISTDNLNVRALPSGSAEKLKWAAEGLPPGTVVKLLNTEGNWSMVQVGENKGWVYTNYIRRM